MHQGCGKKGCGTRQELQGIAEDVGEDDGVSMPAFVEVLAHNLLVNRYEAEHPELLEAFRAIDADGSGLCRSLRTQYSAYLGCPFCSHRVQHV